MKVVGGAIVLLIEFLATPTSFITRRNVKKSNSNSYIYFFTLVLQSDWDVSMKIVQIMRRRTIVVHVKAILLQRIFTSGSEGL